MSEEEQLAELGFEPALARRAIEATNGSGLQAALDWIAEHQDTYAGKHAEDEAEESSTAPKALCCNECGKLFSSVEFAQLHAAKSGHQDFSESEQVLGELSPEQKAQRLAELKEKLAEKRRLDQVLAEREARDAELLRRKGGHMAVEARRELAEREIKKAAVQLRQDREEEKVIRARIRAEMEEEKQLRRERSGAARIEDQKTAPPTEPIKMVSSTADSVRIQVKFSDGTSLKVSLKPVDKLSALLDHIAEEHIVTPNSRLTIPFPHKVIDLTEDANESLMDLGLCPSASLVFE